MSENFSTFLLYGCALGEKMCSQLDNIRPPYWCRCLHTLSFALNKKISQDYEKNNIPEQQRFLKLKEKFSSLYYLFEEEFSKPFMTINDDGSKVLNDEWIRFEGEADLNDHEQVPNTTLDVVNKTNRGICITLIKKDERNPEDIEFPLSEMFHAAIYIRSTKKVELNYPICVLFFIYGAIYYSTPNCNPQIKIELEKFRLHSEIKPKKLTEQFGSTNKKLQKMMELNSDFITCITKSVEDEIDKIKDEDIFSISDSAKSGLELLDSGKGDIFELIKSFMPGSDVESAEGTLNMMGMGTSKNDIKNLVDYITSDDPENNGSFREIVGKISGK